MESVKIILCIVLFLTLTSIARGTNGQIVKRPNVLLLVLDDFRPAIKAFGDTKAITPNIDRLVKKGYYFTNAFAQVSSNLIS